MKKWTSQWNNLAQCEGMDPAALLRMVMLRRQMLLHAYIYYVLDGNIISDHEWDRRAQELLKLQQQHGWNINFYDSIFKHWQGQSGYWLPTNKPGLDDNIDRVARRMLSYNDKIKSMPDAVLTATGFISAEFLKPVEEAKIMLDKI